MAAVESSHYSGNFLIVGKISKPHGIKGELKVFSYSGDPADFLQYKTVLLVSSGKEEPFAPDVNANESREIEVKGVRPQGKFSLITLNGITSRVQAEEVVGLEVWTRNEYLPELEAGEFFWHEMKGLTVLTEDGRNVGVVQGLLATGGHDILVVKDNDREYLIPAKEEFLVEIDRQKRIITIAPPPGLLEING